MSGVGVNTLAYCGASGNHDADTPSSGIQDSAILHPPSRKPGPRVSWTNDVLIQGPDPDEPGTVDLDEENDEALYEQEQIEVANESIGFVIGGDFTESQESGTKEDQSVPNASGRVNQKLTKSKNSPLAHPKGTYFRDNERRIDYVLVFEHTARRRSLTSTINELRRLSRTSSMPVLHTLTKTSSVSGIGAIVMTDKNATQPTEDSIEVRREFFLSQLLKNGLELELHEYHEQDTDRKLVFVKVHAPWSVLAREAERLRMKLPLLIEDRKAAELREKEQEKMCWRIFEFNCLKSKNPKNADDPVNAFGDNIHWCFSNDQIDRFFIPEKPETLFEPCQRSEIVWDVMQLARNDPASEKSRGIESLLGHGVFEAAYPLHDGDYDLWHRTTPQLTTRQRLHEQWATMRKFCRPQPLNRIRNYFSEKVAFYFAFMDFYTKMLIVPAIFGVFIFFYGLISSGTAKYAELQEICDPSSEPGNFVMCPICQPPACEPYRLAGEGCNRSYWQYRLDNETTFLTAAFTVLWCAFFVKFWRRREARLAVDWETHDISESLKVLRPHYEKKATRTRPNMVTDEMEPYVGRHKRLVWRTASILVTFALLCLACLCLAMLVVCRVLLYGLLKKAGGILCENNVDIARWLQHGLMFIMVTVFELVYHRVAEHLTKLECPKLECGYLSSLLWKIFVFALLVDFLPIAYAAWFKGRWTETPKDLSPITELCEAGGCMNEVVELVAVLLLLRLFIQNLLEVGYPAIKASWARFKTRRRSIRRNMQDSVKNTHRWSQFLKDYHLNELNESPEYMEMMIQFSFVAFFTSALPLVPLMCLINNIIEIRVDAVNFLASHRRPNPVRVPGIQIWNRFMDIIVKVSVLVNAALLAYTSEIVPRIYHFIHSEDHTFVNYVISSMSWQSIDSWPRMHEYVEERLKDPHQKGAEGGEDYDLFVNLTKCAYFSYRDAKTHRTTRVYFEVLMARAFAFGIFVVVFYFLIYIIGSFIRDTPKNVKDMIKRRQHIVTRALEEEAFRRRVSKRQNMEKISTVESKISEEKRPPRDGADTTQKSNGNLVSEISVDKLYYNNGALKM